MLSKIFSFLTRPLSVYLQATFADPCRTIREQRKPVRVRRERRNSGTFYFVHLLREQRRQVSPETPDDVLEVESVRERYIRPSVH